jgi:gluconolactonase
MERSFEMKFTGMKKMVLGLASGLFFAVATLSSGQSAVHEAVPTAQIVRSSPALDAVIAADAKVERVATGFIWTEGPMWHKSALWFSDLSGNKMYSLTPDGKLTVLLDHAGGLQSFPVGSYGGSNAMVVDNDGAVLMMQHGLRRIVRLDEKMNVTVFLDKYQGQQFNSPNDLVFAPDGALYFTDPPYGFYDATAPGKDLDKDPRHVLKFNGVYRYKDGKLTAVITDLSRPNGLAFSHDGKAFYVANSANPPALYKYDVKPDGSVANPQVFADFSNLPGAGTPDGMKLDSRGNIWSCGPGGFFIYSPRGELLGKILLPEVTSNIAWGGDDGKTAYFTAATSIYKLQVKIPGQLPVYH